MRNRVNLDSLSRWRVDDVALRENRSCAEAAAVLIGDGYRVRRPSMPNSPDPSTTSDLTDDAASRGRSLSFHVKQAVLDGVKKLAEREERSLSSTIKLLIREGLRSRGLLTSKAPESIDAHATA